MAHPCRTRENRAFGSCVGRVRRFARGTVCLLVLFATQACHKTSLPAPVKTLTLIDQAWSSREYQRRLNDELARFTQQTGIQVEFLPAPETAGEQLATFRNLLENGTRGPDVYGIDVVFPGILADDLLDLRAYVPEQEIQAHLPELIANNTVNGRLVASKYRSMCPMGVRYRCTRPRRLFKPLWPRPGSGIGK